jgi:CHAT domain-containing protein
MLLVADPTPPRQSTLDAPLPRLPGARVEVGAIGGQLRRHQATTLQDAAATEARVRELVSDRGVLHFATHAVVRDDDPFSSYIALGPSGPDRVADGVLTAEEVYGLRLRADLVVLSACRSAAGAVRGDAMATFARAFLYAGTASLVASLWDVADEPTNRLVPAFYRSWLRGADKATALRRAQLQLLSELRAGTVRVSTPLGPVPVPEHPVFWAGFALFGEPQ